MAPHPVSCVTTLAKTPDDDVTSVATPPCHFFSAGSITAIEQYRNCFEDLVKNTSLVAYRGNTMSIN